MGHRLEDLMTETALRLADATARDGITRLEAGVMATDDKARILLLRRAPGAPQPDLWEIPSGRVKDGEPPEQTAERVLREQAGVVGDLADYAGHVDYTTAEGVPIRQLVFTAHVGMPTITLSPEHDGHAWRYADALPAVRQQVLGLLRRIAPEKPMLDADEWQNSLPRWHIGANALVRDQHGRILLVRPRRGDRFQLPGGQVDAHETPQEAAGRELREETGLDLPVGSLISISFEHPSPGWDYPTQIMLFDLGSVDSATVQLTTCDPDIAEHRWAHPGEAEHLLGTARTERLRAGFLGLRQGYPALVTTTDPEII
jgi:8-oxo-dGTP pyrophosphatase MutT (NUDIX family)